MYRVRCLRCEFTAEVPTLGAVFRLEEEHKAETGDRHLLDWTQVETSTPPGSTGAQETGED